MSGSSSDMVPNTGKSLAEQLAEYDGDAVEMLRHQGDRFTQPKKLREYTNWIDEQRATREAVVFADLTYHQGDQHVYGPDAVDLISDLCVNSFENLDVGTAKQVVMVNPHGEFIGDAIFQYIGENEFVQSGTPYCAHWLAYNLEKGDYDATQDFYPRFAIAEDDPKWFTHQVQGPDALDVMQEITDEPLPEIPFFDFDFITIDGVEVRALRHGMAGEPGFELQGPYEEEEHMREVIFDAGEKYGIRELGGGSYQSLSVQLGWISSHVPAVHASPELEDYREWLDAGMWEGNRAIAGSFNSDDIRDYYLSPYEMGYGRLVSFDHDFIGREALEEQGGSDRSFVTLVWNDDDVVDVYGSLFRDGATNKFWRLPRDRWGNHYDEVLADGEQVGIGKSFTYTYTERVAISMAIVEDEYAEPGTEVSFTWGEDGEWGNPLVEDHAQTEIRATVAPPRFVQDTR